MSETVETRMADVGTAQCLLRRRVGSTTVTALTDGHFDLDFEVFPGLDPVEGAALLRRAGRPSPPRIQVNAFLIEQPGQRILVDTGCGAHLGPTVNRLHQSLAAAGANGAGVDKILCTHIHPDHTNGLVDAAGAPAFPNAEVYVHAADAAFWLSDENRARAPDLLKVQFDWAKAAFAPYRDRLTLISPGDLLPGIQAIALPGHTPGHCGFLVHSGDDAVLIWGDAVHSLGIQTARPDVTFASDVDGEAARRTRLKLFDQVAADRLLVTGMHVEYPGFGHITRDGNRFHHTPEP